MSKLKKDSRTDWVQKNYLSIYTSQSNTADKYLDQPVIWLFVPHLAQRKKKNKRKN